MTQRHDDAHYRKLQPQPSEVIAGWSETADWPRKYVWTLGETIAAIARAWTKGQTIRDLEKAQDNLRFILFQLKDDKALPDQINEFLTPAETKPGIVERVKEIMREEREQGGKRN